MQPIPRHRLACTQPLRPGARVTYDGNQAHYLIHVLRLAAGTGLALFSRADGEWLAVIESIGKRSVVLQVREQRRAPAPMMDCWACFAPIKGGRLETIIEKATELGASVLQPVLTQRSIVDKVNAERAESIAREAAEQCERIDWPTIAAPKKFPALLGDWPSDRLLIYGDETGKGIPITELISSSIMECVAPQLREPRSEGFGGPPPTRATRATQKWAILTGPEGGFTPEELQMLQRLPNAKAVSLGPRILRADTALITLAAITMAAWGDWHHRPRFIGSDA